MTNYNPLWSAIISLVLDHQRLTNKVATNHKLKEEDLQPILKSMDEAIADLIVFADDHAPWEESDVFINHPDNPLENYFDPDQPIELQNPLAQLEPLPFGTLEALEAIEEDMPELSKFNRDIDSSMEAPDDETDDDDRYGSYQEGIHEFQPDLPSDPLEDFFTNTPPAPDDKPTEEIPAPRKGRKQDADA